MLRSADKTLDSIAAQIVTLEIYDDEMKITESSTEGSKQYSLNALHEAEDLSIVDPYDQEMDKYLNANVMKYLGIPFDKFLSLPRYECEKILARCDRLANKEAEEAENALNPLRQRVRDTLPQRGHKRR